MYMTSYMEIFARIHVHELGLTKFLSGENFHVYTVYITPHAWEREGGRDRLSKEGEGRKREDGRGVDVVREGTRKWPKLNLKFSFISESNILVLMKCQCADILDCGCDLKDKFQVSISDFDSVKPFSPSCSSVARSGTLFYRPPEVMLHWLSDTSI